MTGNPAKAVTELFNSLIENTAHTQIDGTLDIEDSEEHFRKMIADWPNLKLARTCWGLHDLVPLLTKFKEVVDEEYKLREGKAIPDMENVKK